MAFRLNNFSSTTEGVFAIGSLLFSITYLYYIKEFTFWEFHKIRGPTPWPFFGNSLKKLCRSKKEVHRANRKHYGNVHGIYEGSTPILIIADPEIIKSILVTDAANFARISSPIDQATLKDMLIAKSGEEWRRLKTIVAPVLTSAKISNLQDLVQRSADNLLRALEAPIAAAQASNKHSCARLTKISNAYALDAIATACYAGQTSCFEEPPSQLVKAANKLSRVNPWAALLASILPCCAFKALGLSLFSNESVAFFRDLTLYLIAQRKQETIRQETDCLQLLIEARLGKEVVTADLAPSESHYFPEGKGTAQHLKRSDLPEKSLSVLTENEIAAQSIMFLWNGREPIASTVANCLVHLAANDDAQGKLLKELSARKATDKLSTLPYLDAVVAETLRLNPPEPQVWRRTVDTFEFPETLVPMPGKTLICVDIDAMHRDENLFEHPDEFIPERFMPAERKNMKPFSYLPFGAGPGACIGASFSLLLVKHAVASVVLRHKLLPAPPPCIYGRILCAHSRDPLKIKLEKR